MIFPERRSVMSFTLLIGLSNVDRMEGLHCTQDSGPTTVTKAAHVQLRSTRVRTGNALLPASESIEAGPSRHGTEFTSTPTTTRRQFWA